MGFLKSCSIYVFQKSMFFFSRNHTRMPSDMLPKITSENQKFKISPEISRMISLENISQAPSDILRIFLLKLHQGLLYNSSYEKNLFQIFFWKFSRDSLGIFNRSSMRNTSKDSVINSVVSSENPEIPAVIRTGIS